MTDCAKLLFHVWRIGLGIQPELYSTGWEILGCGPTYGVCPPAGAGSAGWLGGPVGRGEVRRAGGASLGLGGCRSAGGFAGPGPGINDLQTQFANPGVGINNSAKKTSFSQKKTIILQIHFANY